MPSLWTTTVAGHRHEVREAVLDAAAALVRRHGPLSLTMSQLAEEAGIGRATLYRYFPDVHAVLDAWHHRQVAAHLAELRELGARAGGAGERLAATITAYAQICHDRERHGAGALGALLHGSEAAGRAEQELRGIFGGLLAEAAEAGVVRQDVPPGELATFCLHALSAAGDLPSKVAVRRLASVTLAALRSPG